MQASKGHQPQMPDFNVFTHYQSQDLHLWDLFGNLCGKLVPENLDAFHQEETPPPKLVLKVVWRTSYK